ncbi:YqjK family protein [Musicola keenii]|uniref:YqjK family protein n=1 Tax=Musicola keenii TaxID=2884250 RepID=UPI001784F8B8|nr:YqjK family protein [Musicola keenii]
MNRQRQLATEKSLLLQAIQQQRLELTKEKKRYLTITAPYDYCWQRWERVCRYLPLALPLLVLLGLRSPHRTLRWLRRAGNLWSTIKLVQHLLPRP